MTSGGASVLIVDDDAAVTASLGLLLKQAGYRFDTAPSPERALEKLGGGEHALVLQDMNFSRATSGEEGLALLGEIKRRRPGLPVILMTAWGSIELAVAGMKSGASDFVTKPWTHPQLLGAVKTALGLAAASRHPGQAPPSRAELDARYDLDDIAGEDSRLLSVLDVIGRVAGTDASVLVTGESGTGKELVAAALHANSARASGPFVKVNLGGIPPALFESEMFGHVKGAFTDAHRDRRGRFELAHGGTIFLDEIGDLDPGAQVKLLRVLQDRTYEVLGSSVTRSVDVRVVSATNRDLPKLVESGAFREDLLYRLNLIAIELPPLRKRSGDIRLLSERFLREVATLHRREPVTLSAGALAWLKTQPWPGNVRQLRHLLERAVLVSGKAVLDADDFEAARSGEEREQAQQPGLPAVGAMTLDEMERAMILKSLEHHRGNLTRVAESLGLSRAALYRRLEKYGIAV